MESLPEQIERIILSKLSPNDREAVIQSIPGWDGRYERFLVNWPQYTPLDLRPMDVFLREYRFLVKQILGGHKCLGYVGMCANMYGSSHATFVYNNYTDINIEYPWVPFFRYYHPCLESCLLWCVGKHKYHVTTSHHGSSHGNETIASNVCRMQRHIRLMYKQYTMIMRHYLEYFEGICQFLRQAFSSFIPSDLSRLLRVLILHKRFACTGILYRGYENTDTFTIDYDPSEFMNERIFIRCKHPTLHDQILFECNEVTCTLSLQPSMTQDSILTLLRMLAKYSKKSMQWKLQWLGGTSKEVDHDDLVNMFPEILCKPRWKVYKKEEDVYIELF